MIGMVINKFGFLSRGKKVISFRSFSGFFSSKHDYGNAGVMKAVLVA